MQNNAQNSPSCLLRTTGESIGRMTDLKEGEIVTFGRYKQDDDASNDTKPIEWIVLTVEDNRVLLLSRYVLDVMPYHKDKKYIPWKSCSLRKWLNKDFYNNAFTAEERGLIVKTDLKNAEFIYLFRPVNTDTKDMIFPMSRPELALYTHIVGERIAPATPYALSKKVVTHFVDEDFYERTLKEDGVGTDVIGQTVAEWWVRSNADGWKTVDYTWISGSRGGGKTIYDNYTGVRPALYVQW